ncbi:hypothetical protein JW930_05545, partial [Candidatus Woesearchaeota archaeon]|nr:hypothetical protein [Candidatus Woesearchaeota archaeon]
NITVINSGGLKNSSLSDGLVIDLVPPDNIVIQTQKFKNISTGDWQDIPGGDCINTLDLNFSWYADDADSYISGYSYLLTSDSTKNPDQIPEGLIGQLECETFHLFEDIGSASYYFKVRARDAATNWGEIKNFSFCVDNSPPHWLRLISSNFDPKSKKITFIWTASSDEQSGILNYMINITDPNNNVLSYETSGTSYELSVTESGDYTAIVGARNGADIWRWSTEGDSTTDLTPPGVYVITNGVLITDNPILMIKTDEKSVCEYSFDNSVYYRFLYTNSTYHETKTSAPQGANLVYLNCTDMSRNSNNSVTMSFTVNTTTTIDSIWVPDTLSEYQGILISVLVNVTDTDSVKLGGVVLDQFDVEIDDADIEFSIFDQGNGHYNLSFNIPSELGTHGLIVKTRNRESNELDLTVLPLRLSVDYRESQINSPTRTEQTVYGSTTSDIGLATEDTNADFDYGSGYLNLSSDYTKNVFIFNTPSFTNIIRKDRYLENSEFLDLTTPSFGYAYTDSYYLRLILYYKDISLLLDNPFGLSRRRQDIMLQKTFTGAKRTVIISKMVS